MIYLDYAAATPLDPRVAKVMQPYWQERFYNPSASYLAAKAVARDLQAARASLARILGARPPEIIFTAGGTESDNLAINGVMAAFPKAKLVVSAIEHEAVLAAAEQYRSAIAPVNAKGVVDLTKLATLIDDQTVLVSLQLANNELGTIQPVKQVAGLVQAERQRRQKSGNSLPIYLHSDASQAANYLDLHVSRLGVDLLTLNGGKIYGPKQTGVLYARTGVRLQPQIRGGGQENGRRSGTENVAGFIGLACALERAQALRRTESQRLSQLRQQLLADLAKLPAVALTVPRGPHLPNIVHFAVPGTDNEQLIMQLDEAGIQLAAGSACSASNDQASHVLTALGWTPQQAQTSIRVSMGRQTTAAQLRTTVKTLAKLLA